ncbi:hypothetical protein MKW98_025033 [Papaver atlanticum]|uniref:Uncharacterized protein n=1 Tax=Papaver atlanticum TaxID=357466 RepID=A0AAD4T210_9MAGN|nr:hypothetical protein MKW98_025033 [Papaver atlanticum]
MSKYSTRNPNETFSDFEKEEEDETLQHNKDVQEEESDVDSNEGKDNDDGDETGVGKELENAYNGSDDKPEDEVVEPTKRRKFVPRGPTQMHAMKLDNIDQKAIVPFNFKQQQIGDPSVQLASCLGQRFIVPENYQDYYFAKMGAYLKESQSRKAVLVLEALDQLQGEEREKRLSKLMPTSMSVSEWETFVKRVNSSEFRVKRLKMQEIRSKHNTPHTISQKGYAQLEVEMQKDLNTTEQIDRDDLWKEGHKQHKGRDPNPGVLRAFHGSDFGSSLTDDVLIKALGEDKEVRLKGMGFGVTRKKIAANTHYKLIIKECQEKCRAMNDRLVMLEEKSSKCVCAEVHSHRDSPVASKNLASSSRVVPCNGKASTPTTSPVSRSNEVQVPERFTPYRLLSWYKDGEVVADAKISETDPTQEIHGMLIGFGSYTVCVIISHVEGAHVYNPTSEFKYVADAVGSIFSLPKDRIVFS